MSSADFRQAGVLNCRFSIKNADALKTSLVIKTGLMPVEWKADNYVDAIIALLGNDDRNNKILKRYTEILLQ